MRLKLFAAGFALFLGIAAIGCSQNRPNLEADIKQSLEESGLEDVSVRHDTDEELVTLEGEVGSESDKARAEFIAKSAAGGQMIANQIAVRPPGEEDEVQGLQSALDDGIEENFEAALIQNKLEDVDYDSKEGVLTLTGTVDTPAMRQQAERLAAAVPNVKQVVNMIEVVGQTATPPASRR